MKSDFEDIMIKENEREKIVEDVVAMVSKSKVRSELKRMKSAEIWGRSILVPIFKNTFRLHVSLFAVSIVKVMKKPQS